MARQISAVLAATLLLPQAAAAGETLEQSVPCVGPMCVLTPLYRLRTMMPDMPSSSEPPKAPAAPPASSSQAQSATTSTAPDEANSAINAAPQQEPDKKEATAADEEVKSGSNIHSVRSREARHTKDLAGRRTPAQRAGSAGRMAHRNSDTASETPVTIVADATETDRMLRMASVVQSPRLRVVTPTLVEGCRQKPDFLVDTMSNPDRVGPAIPLFTESLIILARKDVQDLAGLKGRQVSFGLSGSSSQRIAQRVFRSLQIDVQEQPLDLDNAIDDLTLGGVDAVAFLAPEGFSGLAHHDPQLHLLAVPDRLAPLGGLRVTRLDPAAYLKGLWPSSNINVVTVDAALSPSQAAHMQPNAQAVYAALDRRASDLAARGFDLLGGSDGLTTMRSSVKDEPPPAVGTSNRPGC